MVTYSDLFTFVIMLCAVITLVVTIFEQIALHDFVQWLFGFSQFWEKLIYPVSYTHLEAAQYNFTEQSIYTTDVLIDGNLLTFNRVIKDGETYNSCLLYTSRCV